MPIRVLLIDEQALLLEGLRLLLEMRGRMEVVDAAADVNEALGIDALPAPDVILLELPAGELAILPALAALRERWPAAKVLAILPRPVREQVTAALLAGANGLIARSCESYELFHAIRSVADGTRYLSGEVAHCLTARPAQATPAQGSALRSEAPDSADPMHLLSAREREVLRMVAQGESSPAIAQRLGLSTNTVDTYRSRLRAKLGVESTADLVKFAIRNQLVAIE